MEQNTLKDTFKETYDLYADAIFRLCVLKTSNEDVAVDLMQETFMRYWAQLSRGKEMRNTRAFLYTIAGNLVIDWYRKKKSESLDARMEDGYEPEDHLVPSGEHAAEHAEMLRAFRQLSESDQEVLTLRCIEGLQPREIAEMLDVTANVVSVRIDRAQRRLAKLLHA